MISPTRIFGGHDPLDRIQAVIEPASGVMQLVQQFLVATAQRRRSLPLRYVVEDEPRQANE